jgi:putative SOS response-associated peptidase YedK
MCGRYNILPSADAWVSVLETFGEAIHAQLRALQPMADVRPSTLVPAICWSQGEEGPRLEMMRWGLVPHFWRADQPQPPEHTFNARIESMPGGAMWRDPIRYTRALMPGSSWIEWQQQTDPETGELLKDSRTRRQLKVPHALRPADGEFFFAALYAVNDQWRPGLVTKSCAIITMDPINEELRAVHTRMPVILKPAAYRDWLDPNQTDAEKALALLRSQHETEYQIIRGAFTTPFEAPLLPAAPPAATPKSTKRRLDSSPQRDLFG